MKEDTWFKTERDYFAKKNYQSFKLSLSVVNKLLEAYNKFLQEAVLGEGSCAPEDLKLTILYARGGKNASDSED